MGNVQTTATSHPAAAWLYMSKRPSSDKMQKDPSCCKGKITSPESGTTFFEGEKKKKKTNPVNHVTKAVFKTGAVYSCVEINVCTKKK